MQLYDLELSGNCYKVRLFAALTGIELELVPIDLSAGEQKNAAFTALNPWQELPVLIDGPTVIRDSQAILVYLAAKLETRNWWPEDGRSQALIMEWLSIAASEVRNGPNAARLIRKFGYPLDIEAAIRWTNRLLPRIDAYLTAHDWLALERPTIADCAVFPYLALAPEGGINLAPYRALRHWFDRVRAQPGFMPMPGLS
ncbi:glutathione S-transferase [Komagataeibacter europaeus NBRC 3261]|uniref:Protein gstA n=2 Tax=Acetobacteraceae TaxID=433 RepID=G6XM38_9PROT|nr:MULTISPECIES: glutathione S-transferase [Acetobacteraceae]EHH67126.1 protein gstA [Gluconobacter morbifer G707]GAN97532.1 glutathione S-transferase [Komagataeibacter europaeus NBRC 3261]